MRQQGSHENSDPVLLGVSLGMDVQYAGPSAAALGGCPIGPASSGFLRQAQDER